MKTTSLLSIIAALLFASPSCLFSQHSEQALANRNSLDFCPMSPMFHIYVVQYSYALDERNDLLVGFSYSDSPMKASDGTKNAVMDFFMTPNTRTKDVGTSHAYTIILGYKRYLWNGLHLEYQLWPAYNKFYGDQEKRYFEGFDLWNEFRVGYTVDFKIGNEPFYINLQYLFGFGLVKGNKPESFGKEGDPTFRAPLFFVGWRF